MGEIAKLANLPDLLSMFVDFDVSSIRELLPLFQKALNSEVHLDVIVDRWESGFLLHVNKSKPTVAKYAKYPGI